MAARPLPGGEETRGGRSDGPDPSLLALLSLKLLLLAFFILLAALSQYEQERVYRVVESVTDAFGTPFASDISQPSGEAGLGFHDAMKPVAEQLRRVVAESLPVEVLIELRRDGELRVELPYELLFDPYDAAPRATVRPLLVALSRALVGPRFETLPWTLEAAAYLPGFAARGSTADDSSGESQLAVRRAAAMVRSLRALGLPETQLGAGLLEGDARSLRLAVRPLAVAARP